MGLPAEKHPERFSYADYAAWSDDERWELIDGVPYNMSPAPKLKHQRLSFALSQSVGDWIKGRRCDAFSAPTDVRLPDYPTADAKAVWTVVQPDILVVCDKNKLDEAGVVGAPDFIVEIGSPTTAVKDVTVKLALYERHGVREYWFIDPEDPNGPVLVVWTLETGGRYAPPRFFKRGDAVDSTALPGFTVDLGQLLASVEP